MRAQECDRDDEATVGRLGIGRDRCLRYRASLVQARRESTNGTFGGRSSDIRGRDALLSYRPLLLRSLP